MTALMHLAASKTGDHVIAASYLLQQKADIDIKGPGNKQALDYAIDNEHTAITLCLLKRLPRPEKALFIAETALMVALKSKNIQDPLVQRLVHQEIKNDTNTSFNMAHLNGNRKLCKQILSAHEFFFEQRKKEEEPSVEQLSVKRKELDQIDMPSKSRHCKDKEVAYNAPVKKSGFYRFSLAVIASRLTILPSKKCTEPDDIKALGYDMAFLALDDSSFNS